MKITLIAGSNREQATSTLLVEYIGKLLAERGGHIDVLKLVQLPLPLFSPDQNQSNPHVLRLKESMLEADAVVLASPEYHGGMSGVLKNALDYLKKEHFALKPVLSAASAGGAVGTSCLTQMQNTVRNVHGINCPEWISIGGDKRGFDEQGVPENEIVRTRVQRVVDYFYNMVNMISTGN